MPERFRAVAFTINNPTDEDTAHVMEMSAKARYIVVGKEKGEKGTVHYQGYCYYDNGRSFSAWKKDLPRAHIEPAIAEAEDNRKYCTKDGDILIEKGDMPKPGNRNDIHTVVKELKHGANMRAIIDKANSLQSVKMAEVWLKYNEKGKDWKPEIKWFHGSTGSGKTKSAIEWLGDDYYKPLSFKWWEGYDGHENVLLDEIRGDFCKYHEMLALLDRYKYRVECKGGSRQLLAKKIAITSPYKPEDLYHTIEDVQQLLRRITEVVQCGEVVHRSKECLSFDELEQKFI